MSVLFILETTEDISPHILEREDLFWNLVEHSVKEAISLPRTDISKVINGTRDVSKKLAKTILRNADRKHFQDYIESLITQGNERRNRNTLLNALPDNPYGVPTDDLKSDTISFCLTEAWFKYLKNCANKVQHRTKRKPIAIDPLDIEARIKEVIQAFKFIDESKTPFTDAKKVKEKIDRQAEPHLFKKIEGNVNDYFADIRKLFIEEQETGDLIFEQIRRKMRNKYLEKKKKTPREVFNDMVDWLMLETSTTDREACEAVISYFIQDCEVF